MYGTLGNYFFFALHLMDIVVRDPTTQSVLQAVYTPRKSLTMTLRLMMCVLFIFTVVLFLLFPSDFQGGECTKLWTCYVAMFIAYSSGAQRGAIVGRFVVALA